MALWIPILYKWLIYIPCSFVSLNKRVPLSTHLSTKLINATLSIIFYLKFSLALHFPICDLCILRRETKHIKWYIAPNAIKSPVAIHDRSSESWRSVTISWTSTSALRILKLRSLSHSFPLVKNRIHFFFSPNDDRLLNLCVTCNEAVLFLFWLY